MTEQDISLLAFAYLEYDRRSWEMPDVHVRIYDWLARTDGERTRVLRVFRGCGKSTILGIRNAHKFYTNPEHQLLAQGADDDLTDDLSRDTIAVLRAHEMTRDMLMEPAGVRHWWTKQGYEKNARTPQFRGRGILSRVTGNRAEDIQNDDVEVSKNVETHEARNKLRKRLSEQSFILVPGGSRLFVGTPHTHDSLYDQLIEAGAEHLTIPLFADQTRHENGGKDLSFGGAVGRDGVWVFIGIGAHAKLLEPGRDYTVTGNTVRLKEATTSLVDICVGNAWPERFHRKEMLDRRKECNTTGYWDSQYMLKARPTHDVRLDPDKIPLYDVEPHFDRANKVLRFWLGKARLIGATGRWDPSAAKLKSDASAFALMFQDDVGRRYWHRSIELEGEVAELNDRADKVTGGQVFQICDLVEKYQLRRIVIETNGVGAFAPMVLKMALKQRLLTCGVVEQQAMENKNKRILEAFEPLIGSQMIWAHTSVADGPAFDQMRSWIADVKDQPDDHLDAAAGAATDQPERIGGALRNRNPPETEDWREGVGTFEATLEL